MSWRPSCSPKASWDHYIPLHDTPKMIRAVHSRPVGLLGRLISGLVIGLVVAVLGATLRAGPPPGGPGGPILVVTSAANPFSQYYAEILRAEGLNSFSVMDLTDVTATTLNAYDVVILGEMPLTTGQATMFSDWVFAGGNLIAMRPDKRLASLLGLVDAGATLPEAYMLVDTSAAPGFGASSDRPCSFTAAPTFTRLPTPGR